MAGRRFPPRFARVGGPSQPAQNNARRDNRGDEVRPGSRPAEKKGTGAKVKNKQEKGWEGMAREGEREERKERRGARGERSERKTRSENRERGERSEQEE